MNTGLKAAFGFKHVITVCSPQVSRRNVKITDSEKDTEVNRNDRKVSTAEDCSTLPLPPGGGEHRREQQAVITQFQDGGAGRAVLSGNFSASPESSGCFGVRGSPGLGVPE